EFQIGLDGDDARILAVTAGKCNRHVGLGLLAEINRTEVSAVTSGFSEYRIERKILPAACDVHRQAGYPQLLVTALVEVAHFGDGRHLAQKPQRIEPALSGRRCIWRPRRLSYPSHLVLQIAHEVLDAHCRRDGLFPLNARECSLVFLIREIHLDEPAFDDREAGEEHQRDRVFQEEAALRDHLSTSSARSRIDSGIATPSAFAVFRLMVSLNLAASSTGRSPGAAPRNRRSMKYATRPATSVRSGA